MEPDIEMTKSQAPAAASENNGSWWSALPLHTWTQIGIVATLFIMLHWHVIELMAKIARDDHDWSHAYLVPFFSLYFVYQQRERILRTPVSKCWWGLPIFVFALAAHVFAIFPVRSLMLRGYTMILELLAIVLLLLGWRMLLVLWFPICYLGFGIKFSTKVWDVVAWRLQTFAAHNSVVMLNVLGVDADVRGSTIELWKGVEYLGALNVAEACSGLRMLIAFVALGVAIVYIVPRPWWARGILLLLTVPIAILVNVLRVTVTGLLHLVNPDLSAGDFHVFVGMLMVFPAVVLFLCAGWLLDHLFVEEPVDEDDDRIAETNRGDNS